MSADFVKGIPSFSFSLVGVSSLRLNIKQKHNSDGTDWKNNSLPCHLSWLAWNGRKALATSFLDRRPTEVTCCSRLVPGTPCSRTWCGSCWRQCRLVKFRVGPIYVCCNNATRKCKVTQIGNVLSLFLPFVWRVKHHKCELVNHLLVAVEGNQKDLNYLEVL